MTKTERQEPGIGQIVSEEEAMRPVTGKFVSYVGDHNDRHQRAAVITMAGDTAASQEGVRPLDSEMNVHLFVYTPGFEIPGFPEMNVPYDPNKEPGTWHWPENV